MYTDKNLRISLVSAEAGMDKHWKLFEELQMDFHLHSAVYFTKRRRWLLNQILARQLKNFNTS